MTPEQASKLRKGDRILVEMVVVEVAADKVDWPVHAVSVEKPGRQFWPPLADIHASVPRPLEAGDRVRLPNPMFHQVGVLLAIDGEECWVRWDDGARNTQDLSDLQRVDDEDRKAKEG